MKRLPIALLFAALTASGAAAQADQARPQPASPPAVETPAAEDDEKIVVEGELPDEKRKVCEVRTSTGSIMPKRVCRTVAQIERDQRAALESMERSRNDSETYDLTQLTNAHP